MSTTPAAAETPKSTGEKALAAVPVFLTVMATVLAGLSSSEMTQSMYFRSMAAQYQSKAGSQWAFFQAKRIRGTTMESGRDLIRAVADPPSFDSGQFQAAILRIESAATSATGPAPVADAVKRLRDLLSQKAVRSSLQILSGPELPVAPESHAPEEQIQEIIRAIEARQTERQTSDLVARVPANRIEIALEMSETNAAAFDTACGKVTADIRAIENGAGELRTAIQNWQAAVGAEDARRGANDAAKAANEIVASLRLAIQDFTARRYAKEAAFNQESAELYEILVRRTGAESDRHRTRSKNFFYAMLCAQAGVTVAALALARSRKSWFWAVAGIAGAIAISFGAYVYVAL